MTDRFYVTTPIYYVNAAPHIGTAYTTIAADAFARYHALRGARTWFLTGTDEHGLKIERAAKERGMTPQQFADEVSDKFRAVWPRLLVRPDDFIRTTEPRHIERVQKLWEKCAAAGDIYLGEHEGLYCVACEEFKTEKDLLEGKLCPIHKRAVEYQKEPTYFFRLSRYGEQLLALWERRPELVQPESRLNEVRSFVKDGLRDLSVSRTSFKWGIPVPGAPDHVMYVWFDALANYLTALGDGELRETFWPPDAHLVGKDILRFHAVYWPAFLLSAGFREEELPRALVVHGFLTSVNGEKIGKSMLSEGSPLDPVRLVDGFGADEVRYFLLREIAFGQDGGFSHQALIHRIRAELSGTLGNLLHRTLGAFVVKHFDSRVPRPDPAVDTEAERQLRARAAAAVEEAGRAWREYEPHRALEATMNLAIAGNKYFDERAPWALAKSEATRGELANVIYHVLETLRICSLMIWPAMPVKMDGMRAQLGLEPVAPQQGLDRWPLAWGGLAPGERTAPGQPLFRNISKDDEARLLREFGGEGGAGAKPPPGGAAPSPPAGATGGEAQAKAAASGKKGAAKVSESKATEAASANAAPGANAEAGTGTGAGASAAAAGAVEGVAHIQYGDFEKVELRLGHVKTAERIPKKDKLLQLSVDLGEPAGPRTIIAGIALAYAPEQLVGKQIVIVANLAPRDFGKGLVSHGMLLACGPSESLSVVTIEKPMPAGTRVK